jgi:hypothetical protein
MTQVINNTSSRRPDVPGQSFVGASLTCSISPKAQLFFEGGFVGGIATGQVN